MKRVLMVVAAVMVAVCGAGEARAQIAGTAASGAAAPASSDTKVYTNAELHLTFTYPAELAPVDAASVAVVAQRMVYGDDSSKDECTKVLLSVGEGREGGQGVWARVGVVQVNAQCFPAKVLREKKATDGLLRNLARQATTVMGMMPVEQPAGYEIEGRRACFAAAQGTPVTAGDVQTAGEELLAVAAVSTEGRLVAWVIETNDQALFNRLLGSGVGFGTGKVERLLPGQVQ